MARTVLFCASLAAVVAAPAFATSKYDVREGLPMHIENFRLADLDGQMHELHDWADSKAIVLFVQGNGCPIVRQTFPYFMEIRDEFEPKGVTFAVVNSNAYDDPESIRQELKDYNVDVLALKDPLEAVARSLDCERTAEMFLIDPKTWTIVYRGEADDRFGYGLQRSNPQKFYMKDALDGWLADQSFPETRVRITKGCLMDLTDLPQDVKFDADVKPVLDDLCTKCDHTDPDACISAWDESHAKANTQVLWNMLLMQRTPDAACCDKGAALNITKAQALTLMGWLWDQKPKTT